MDRILRHCTTKKFIFDLDTTLSKAQSCCDVIANGLITQRCIYLSKNKNSITLLCKNEYLFTLYTIFLLVNKTLPVTTRMNIERFYYLYILFTQ